MRPRPDAAETRPGDPFLLARDHASMRPRPDAAETEDKGNLEFLYDPELQ